MSKKKKKNKSQPSNNESILSGIQIPDLIQGASFSESSDSVEQVRLAIESGVNNDLGRPVRVMFISEASFMHTGFSTYVRETLSRLQADDRFECAELGSYAHQELGDSHNLPWKFYGGKASPGDAEGLRAWQSVKINQFGAAQFEDAVTDFQPDVVLLHRDAWMDTWVVDHPLASKFHTIWMTCVDSYPQQWDWLKSYAKADTILAYADFGKKVMEEQTVTELAKAHKVKPLNADYVCRPGVALDEFFPLNKAETKKKYGIRPDTKIIGSVMRNQPRKLFPTIIEAFKNYLVDTGDDNAMLLLHTGYPDIGWDIPEYIHRFGVNHKVLFSTICHSCNHNSVQLWGFEQRPCSNCGKTGSIKTCNVAKGLENERFNEIYNLMDLYVQASIAGADEMPATEAKAAGVPVACTEYAAMYEKAHAPGGIPLKVSTFYHEAETKQTRAYVDHKSITRVMKDMLGSENRRVTIGQMGRKHIEQHYTWDITADKWKAAILNAELKDVTWEASTVGFAVVGSEQALIQRTLGSLPEDASIQIVSDDSEIEGEWIVVLNAGDVFMPGKTDLQNEVFLAGPNVSAFMIPVLKKLENGTVDNHAPILEPVLRRIGFGTGETMVVTSDKQVAGVFIHQTNIISKGGSQDESHMEEMKMAIRNSAEGIRRHIESGQAYIIRRNNG